MVGILVKGECCYPVHIGCVSIMIVEKNVYGQQLCAGVIDIKGPIYTVRGESAPHQRALGIG